MTKTLTAGEKQEREQVKKVQQEQANEHRDALREVLRQCEVKRVNERLTKKELCNIYGLNYNFYMNCISGRNFPSKKMDIAMGEYLKTPTTRVYEMVFAFRDKELEFHQSLGVSEEHAEKSRKFLTEQGVLSEPHL